MRMICRSVPLPQKDTVICHASACSNLKLNFCTRLNIFVYYLTIES